MLNTKFSPWPSFSIEESSAVSSVLLSNKVNYWTGELCKQFEVEFASWAGVKYAVALANGTLALEFALKSLGVGPNDEVIVTPRTYIASVSCVVSVGAKPVFADVDVESGCISGKTIEKVITPKTKAIICVHLGGWPCDMDSIMQLASSRGVKVIEDCSQAHGAVYKGKPVGSIGDIGTWSFCQDKIITTGGEGGMVTTNNPEIWEKIWSFKDHGKSYQSIKKGSNEPGYKWVHKTFGTNGRMLEMQAAIGLIQLKRMNEWTRLRNLNARKILDSCKEFGLIADYFDKRHYSESADAFSMHAYYKCYAYLRLETLKKGWSRDRVIHEINELGVPCYQGSCSEVYLEEAFSRDKLNPDIRLNNAKLLGEVSLMFLVHPTLTNAELDLTCHAIKKVLSQAIG